MQDAAFSQFLQTLEYVAWKLGKKIIKVDPRVTSQNCWEYLNKVSKSRSEPFAVRHETYSYPKFRQKLDRDNK
ncbi:MAG: transposase [Trichodesmium sp. MAG_R01]|nr:transposase [Trichodesmium sp. MAG_R01]